MTDWEISHEDVLGGDVMGGREGARAKPRDDDAGSDGSKLASNFA